MTFSCRWHPVASRRGAHTKEECAEWHAHELATLLSPEAAMAEGLGLARHAAMVEASATALRSLGKP